MQKGMIKNSLKQTNLFDVQLMKLCVFFFTLWVATYIPTQFLVSYRVVWLVAFIVFAIPLFYKFFIKSRGNLK